MIPLRQAVAGRSRCRRRPAGRAFPVILLDADWMPEDPHPSEASPGIGAPTKPARERRSVRCAPATGPPAQRDLLVNDAGPRSSIGGYRVKTGRAGVLGRLEHSRDPALARRTHRCESSPIAPTWGQGEELILDPRQGAPDGPRQRAHRGPAEEFVRDFVFPMLRANAVYEGAYLTGHVHRAPLIDQVSGGGGAAGAGRRPQPRGHRQGQ